MAFLFVLMVAGVGDGRRDVCNDALRRYTAQRLYFVLSGCYIGAAVSPEKTFFLFTETSNLLSLTARRRAARRATGNIQYGGGNAPAPRRA